MLSRISQCRGSSFNTFVLLYAGRTWPTACAANSAIPTLSSPGNLLCTRRQLSQTALTNEGQRPASPKPKLHWTEEFKIRSPKVPPGRLRQEPVVAIDIESDAFSDRRIAFVLRRGILNNPLHPRLRGLGKILSYCGLVSLPYLLFCKWAGGTPLLGEMTSYAIPVSVAGVCLGYLALNLALEKTYLANRIYSIALDEADPEMVYITTLPVGGWLHGSFKSYVTLIGNIHIEASSTSKNWSRLTFKAGGEGLTFSLPRSRRKCFVVDTRAMSAFRSSISANSAAAVSPSPQLSDLRSFESVSLPDEKDIDRHLDTSLGANESKENQKEQSKV